MVYPEGTWYHSVSGEVLERIVTEHLRDGRPVEEYVFARNPMPVAPSPESAAREVVMPEPDPA